MAASVRASEMWTRKCSWSAMLVGWRLETCVYVTSTMLGFTATVTMKCLIWVTVIEIMRTVLIDRANSNLLA